MKALKTFACAIAITLSFATAAMAEGGILPADKKAMHDYTLSMDKINAMGAAMGDFKKMGANGIALLNQQKAIYDAANSVADMETRLSANAQIMAVYKAHGLKAADAVLIPFVLMYAGTAASYPAAAAQLADSTSPQQVAFYKQHQKDLQGATWMNGK